MKAVLRTYPDKDLVDPVDQIVEIPDDYKGDPYGNDVPFCVGSNQTILIKGDNHEM